ncbi:ferredoxin [Cupriavidus sp. SHE]|nr:ferredoxin [Cupriavidus sp. HMR-1]KWR82471.1 ferredoxin [Cupriavidus sp. SHE]GMG92563.1 ferredoxin [Cupriavidus sp. TKC]
MQAQTDIGDIDAGAAVPDTDTPPKPRTIEITFVTNGEKTVNAPENSNLLRVSLREQGGIPFKCGGGICGTCKCRIERGLEHTDAVKPKERKHLSDDDLRAGYRMACQTFVKGDIAVSW